MSSSTSYFALRAGSEAGAPIWWNAAHVEQHTAPLAIRALLSGRPRIEVSLEEALEALGWAEHIEGWPHEGPAPVVIYPEPPPSGG